MLSAGSRVRSETRTFPRLDASERVSDVRYACFNHYCSFTTKSVTLSSLIRETLNNKVSFHTTSINPLKRSRAHLPKVAMDFSLRRPTPGFSAAAGPSDLSFQLSNALGSTSQLLLEDDPDDFLAGMDSTLATPAPAAATQTHTDNPLTLAELTPRSRRTRSALKFTPSPRKRAIPSPLMHAASHETDTSVEDSNEATPVKNRPDTTFQIPRMGNDMTQLLMSGDDLDLLSKGTECSFLNTTMLERAPPLPLHRLTSGEISYGTQTSQALI